MAVGNTFGATALSSYGGFWISFAIILTPGGFEIEETVISGQSSKALYDSLGFYLMVRGIRSKLCSRQADGII
jgi:succinate-acetate transporter protein